MDILSDVIEITVSKAGSIPAGALFISVKNTGRAAAVFNGMSLIPGEAKSYPFIGKPYKKIEYNPGTSTLRILYII